MDVSVELILEIPLFTSLESIAAITDGIVIGTVLSEEPYYRVDEHGDIHVFTNYTVAIEDDFGKPFNGCAKGRTTILRLAGGKAKIGDHFYEVKLPGWPTPQQGDRYVFFLMEDYDPGQTVLINAISVLFPIKEGQLQVTGEMKGSCPFAVDKSLDKFTAEIRAAAPLLKTASQK